MRNTNLELSVENFQAEDKKFIFLDIDGVLVTRNTLKTRNSKDGFNNFDSECVKNLKQILKETGAYIVLSSSWRSGNLQRNLSIFKYRGLKFLDKIIGQTGEHQELRGLEIKHWIDKHSARRNNYVILDDDADMLYEQRKNFVQCSMEKGLTKALSNKAIKILNKKLEIV